MKMPVKTIIFSALLALAALGLIINSSCNADKCKTIVCANGSYCQLGACICLNGYEGTNCETVMRQKFMGNWTVFEKGSATYAAQYPISIVIDSAIFTDLYILNFNDSFKHPVLAVVTNGTTLTIPNQQMEGKIIWGKGYIYTPSSVNYNQYSAISMQYEVMDSVTGAINDYGYDAVTDGSKPSAWNK